MCQISSKAYSQNTVLINNDTSICFNLNQSKFLLKSYYHYQYLDSLNQINESKLSLKDSLIKNYIEKDSLCIQKVAFYNEIDSIQSNQIQQLSLQLDKANKKINRQKVFLISSKTLLVLFGILYLTTL